MARIPRSVIDAYTKELNLVTKQNREGLDKALGLINWSASIPEVREQLVEAMQVWCGGAADQAAMLASVFYDGVREIAVGEPMGAFAESRREPERTTKAVRAFVQDLVDGKGPRAVRSKCLDRLDYEAKRAAAECVDANARRDRKRPRYARVPSGTETCDFCIMLASRGPVYHNERSAGAVDHFHANCDCRVVPMWDTYYVGPSRRATASSPVEGYDPDGLYERYVEYMTDGKFRDRMARAADRAKGGDGDVSGRETSHPMLWAKAKREGLVTLGSVKDVQDYIRAATSYEDLFERIAFVSGEWEHYALSEKHRLMVQQTMRTTRDRLLGVKGRYSAISEEAFVPGMQLKTAGAVDHAAVNNKRYHDKYLSLGFPRKTEEELYRQAGRILQACDGTQYERISIVATRSGKHLLDTLGESVVQERAASLSPSQVERLAELDVEVVVIHNHPNSGKVSYKDIWTASGPKVTANIAACHDGTVYVVTSNDRRALVDAFDALKSQVMTEYPMLVDMDVVESMAYQRILEENERLGNPWFEIRTI